MTEQEWLQCATPRSMLECLQGKASHRKLRLLACACGRRAWSLLRDGRSRQAIEVAERYADEQASEKELRIASEAARSAHQALWDVSLRKASPAQEGIRHDVIEMDATLAVWQLSKPMQPHANAVTTISSTASSTALRLAASAVGEAGGGGIEAESAVQASLLRDIFGPLPFRAVFLNPAWLAWNDGTVPRLAQAIYAERAFDRLPILADALEEAGCTNADILAHCRRPGQHVRGCWPVDLILDKK